MAIYRNVSISFWTDTKVDDEFTPEDKYFYLYLLTNPHTNICGCYEIGKKAIERETGYTWDTVSRLLERMQNYHDVIRYDSVTKEVLLLNWGKYNWGASIKTKTAVVHAVERIKNEEFREYIKSAIDNREFKAPEIRDALPKYVNEQKPQPASNNPTMQDVFQYCKEQGYDTAGKVFFYYYDNKDWKDQSGEPIRNWKAVLDAWHRNGNLYSGERVV